MKVDTETHNAYQLARLAECTDPDSLESDGSRWLLRVASDIPDLMESDDPEDTVHEYADGAVPHMTHERWKIFVDLGAYSEDLSELDFEYDADNSQADLTGAAGVALYMIADRLLRALISEAKVAE